MTQSAAPKARISLVNSYEDTSTDAGSALVVGPFPPLIGPSAGHASALLHMFKESGFSVRSAAGPGSALARHSLSFGSETQLRKSSAFLKDCEDYEHAVIYAKSFDFKRVTKPRWYKRRLEELRRLRLVARIVSQFQNTTMILEDHPLQSRYQASLWMVAKMAALVQRKHLKVQMRSTRVSEVFRATTQLKRPTPSASEAEQTAYEAAFDPKSDNATIRLTIGRAEQAFNYWSARGSSSDEKEVADDLSELLQCLRTHDLRDLPHFRLLWSGGDNSTSPLALPLNTRPIQCGNTLVDPKETFGVPITHYMKHLWVSLKPGYRTRISTRRQAKDLLKWYLFEAPHLVPSRWVPIGPQVRDYYLEHIAGFSSELSVEDCAISSVRGRDALPFSLSGEMALIASGKSRLARKYDVDDPIDRICFVFEFLLTADCGPNVRKVLGQSAFDFFAKPIGSDPQNVSRIEFLLGVQARCPISGRQDVEKPWRSESLARFAKLQCAQVFPSLTPILSRKKESKKRKKSFAISGLPKSETGVGSNLHMSASALRKIGIHPEIHDLADKFRPFQSQGLGSGLSRLKKSVVLHHMNADVIPQSATPPVFNLQKNVLHVGFLLWEFESLPQSHLLALEMLDEIWTPSSFLQKVYENASKRAVVNVLKGIHIPEVPDFESPVLRSKGSETVFLTCFDFHSSVARKNPLAAVRAFQTAFPKSRTDVRLVIKTTPPVKSHWGDPENQMDKIEQIAALDHRIELIAEYYTFNRLLALIKACDCLVSAHRAEGFGLMPAYALGLGRPVMATDYSGTTDFCDINTSMPISRKMVPVSDQHVLHPIRGAVWAEIDLEDLVENMRSFERSKTEGRSRAEVGQALIQTKYAPESQAQRYKNRLKALGVL